MNMPASDLNADKKPATAVSRRLALVADDDLSNRLVLGALLKKMGYSVVEAENGAQAIDRFLEARPDIIFMDIMMPVMDGFDATAHIKDLCGDKFVPVIFLTAMTDEKALAHCIEVGGDDFLTKPFSHTLLKSKIHAIERMRDLYREISVLLEHRQREEEIAEKVFSGAVMAGNVALENLDSLMRPAALFSGDVLLTAYAPSGDLHVLLGDFTGHGLSAALGALPVSELFRTMTAKGFSVDQILNEINRKLFNLLPTGIFMAAQFVRVNHLMDAATVCCCGMPDILITDEAGTTIKATVTSAGLPLGIVPDINYLDTVENLPLDPGDRLLLASDGVTEARSRDGELFGQGRLKQAILEREGGRSIVESITRALNRFCGDAPQDDDISLVEVPFLPGVLRPFELEPPARAKAHPAKPSAPAVNHDMLRFAVTLEGPRLLRVDPVPLLINQIQELEGLKEHRRALFTILSELYVNALDHGVLLLDSSLKARPGGFTEYFTEREKRLQSLTSGYVKIAIQSRLFPNGGDITIRVHDSGPGFDFKSLDMNGNATDILTPSGRGLVLVRELCESLSFEEPGNRATAVYSWTDD